MEQTMIEIVYAQEKYFNSFYDTLNSVAKERIYIEMVKAPPLNQVVRYQQDFISKNGAAYYALLNHQVIGWCDITQKDNPRIKHRGS